MCVGNSITGPEMIPQNPEHKSCNIKVDSPNTQHSKKRILNHKHRKTCASVTGSITLTHRIMCLSAPNPEHPNCIISIITPDPHTPTTILLSQTPYPKTRHSTSNPKT